jgi:signal transduction histidine kinase
MRPNSPESGCDMRDDFAAQLEREKLDALKELAYGASHEINNPLANIAARAQTLLRDEKSPDRRRALEAIHQQAMRAHEMISDLMLFARPPRLVPEAVDLREMLERVAKNHEAECERRNVRLTLLLPETPVVIQADPQQLAVAVDALVRNAAEAIGEDGAIEVKLEPPGEDGMASIEVADTGPGISTEVRRHLFDPFFSGREAGRGLGFGLSKCWRIVTDHGGSVVVDESTMAGARLALRLPAGGPVSEESA